MLLIPDKGKTMGYDYLGFDDEVVRSGAKADPISFFPRPSITHHSG